MTKKTLQLLASVALVAGMGITSITTAHAADESSTGSVDTTGNVSLKADDGEDGGDGNAGGIKLKSAPHLNVGQIDIDGSAQRGQAAFLGSGANVLDNDGVLQVANGGNKSDWNVQVSNTAFVSGSDTLNVSTFDLGNATVLPDDTSSTAGLPTALSNVTLQTQGTANVNVVGAKYDATNKTGVGTFNTTYKGATLDLAGGNVGGAYSSKLTWTLTNTPITE